MSTPRATETDSAWWTLGLPLPDAAGAWCATACVLVAYAATLARDLSFYDSAELALAARVGGLGHPTGQPLHTMLGWLASRTPFTPPLVSLALLSALPAALALIAVASIAARLAPDVRSRPARAARAIVPALCALHAALFEPATRVEVYALAAFFALWAVAKSFALLADDARASRAWLLVGVSLGLSAASNPMTAAIAGVAIALPLLAQRSARSVALTTAGGLLGLVPYGYVLAQSRRTASAIFVWGFPGGSHAMARFASGADWSHNRGVTLAELGAHAAALARWSVTHALVALVALGLAGHLAARHTHARRGVRVGLRALAPVALGLTVAWLASNVIFFPDVPDYLGYLEPPLLLCAAGAGAVVARGVEARGRNAVYAGLAALALVASVLLAAPSPFARTRHADRLARAIAAGVLDEAPPDAIVVASSDHVVFPLMYLQQAEGRAPDVVVVPYGLTGSSWFWQQLYARHPSLAPFALLGPGGRAGRVARFLDANARRPARFERWFLAGEVRARACPSGWFLASGAACFRAVDERAVREPSRVLSSWLARLDEGSPASDGVIAQVAQDRGEALWRTGRADLALEALLAGVASPLRAACGTTLDLAHEPPLADPLPAFQDDAPLGAPARNLALAVELLRRSGDLGAATRCTRALHTLE